MNAPDPISQAELEYFCTDNFYAENLVEAAKYITRVLVATSHHNCDDLPVLDCDEEHALIIALELVNMVGKWLDGAPAAVVEAWTWTYDSMTGVFIPSLGSDCDSEVLRMEWVLFSFLIEGAEVWDELGANPSLACAVAARMAARIISDCHVEPLALVSRFRRLAEHGPAIGPSSCYCYPPQVQTPTESDLVIRAFLLHDQPFGAVPSVP